MKKNFLNKSSVITMLLLILTSCSSSTKTLNTPDSHQMSENVKKNTVRNSYIKKCPININIKLSSVLTAYEKSFGENSPVATYMLAPVLKKSWQDVLHKSFSGSGQGKIDTFKCNVKVHKSKLIVNDNSCKYTLKLFVTLYSPDGQQIMGKSLSYIKRSNYNAPKLPKAVIESCYSLANQFLKSINNNTSVLKAAKKYSEEYKNVKKKTVPTRNENVDIYSKKIIDNIPELKNVNHNGIAVIIGNKNYKKFTNGLPNVKYAYNDMKVIKKFLMKVKGYREGNILTVKDASKAKMQLLLGDRKDSKGRISDMIKKGRSDVFVYYSGHGIPGMKEGKGYLVPIDASPDKPNLTCYSLETFFLNLKKLKAKHITVVIDACFSGMSPRNKMLIKDASPAMLKTSKTLPSGTEELTLFTASQPDEIASWNNKANLSLFTSYWIKGLVGNADKDRFGDENGVITIKELKRYLKEKVTYEARKRYGRSQHPQVKYDKNKSLIRLSD